MNLKKFIAISLMSLATCMLFISAIVPHHHHANGKVCLMMMDFCDHHEDDGEDHHHHTADDLNDCENCVTKSDYMLAEYKEEIKCKVSTCNHQSHIDHLPLLYLLADFLIYNYSDETKPPRDGVFVVSYQSVDASRTHGLRAPPYLLV